MVTAAEGFHTLVAELDYPMYVVTTVSSEGERSGCLVGFATQASIHPPRLLAFVSKRNHTSEVARRVEALAVHFLRADDEDLAALFGEQTGDETDKFAACAWDEGPYGLPVLANTRGWVAGPIHDRWDAGDHVGHLISIEQSSLGQPGPQLSFQRVLT